jgi:hypothetical protein
VAQVPLDTTPLPSQTGHFTDTLPSDTDPLPLQLLHLPEGVGAGAGLAAWSTP